MWFPIVSFISLIVFTFSEPTAPGIDRTVSDGVKSLGFNVVYGDDDYTIFNEVITDPEKSALKYKENVKESLPPLPAEDVKCLMSVDRHCSKEMGEIKSVLIQSLRDDCTSCSDHQREKAGRIAASMMAHDPVAWKLFLTRYDGLQRIQRILG